jgi:adenylate cyclase
MGDDEEATIRTITEYRRIITEQVKQHEGRVVDSPGDNVLSKFASVVDALTCAVKTQNEIAERNDHLPDNRKMKFRIGVNLGDIAEDGDRIYGDGVNVAARIESLAEPGGICISRTAYDQVKNKLELGYKYLGEHSVKNITEPVRVYRILTDPEAVGKVLGEKRKSKRGMALAIAVILLIGAGGLTGWYLYIQQSKRIAPASVEEMAFPLPEKPSIVVLPFVNMSGGQDQEYISDGITETLITSLSKIPMIFVIARESSFFYKGKSVPIKQISEELGVRYVLEGSVQRSGNRIRINAQLIDAIKGHHLWAEKYDREFKDLFALQDDIALNVLRSLQVRLVGQTTRGRDTENLEAYLKVMQGLNRISHGNKNDNATARKLYKEAIALDPEYADAYSLLGYTHWWDATFGWSESPKESLRLAEELAQKAISMDSSVPGPHGLVAAIYMTQGQCDKALAKAEQTVATHPDAVIQLDLLGIALNCMGRPEEALSVFKRSLRLSPNPPPFVIVGIGGAYFLTEQYEEIIDFYNKRIHHVPPWTAFHYDLAVAYSLLGREEEAKTEVAKALKIDPNISIRQIEKTLFYSNPDDRNRYISALRKAGMPE